MLYHILFCQYLSPWNHTEKVSYSGFTYQSHFSEENALEIWCLVPETNTKVQFFWDALYIANPKSCKNIYIGILCIRYNLHKLQLINLHGPFALNWNNLNCCKTVIFTYKYIRIVIIAYEINQDQYFCGMQTLTVCIRVSTRY